jgi:polyphosphate kinase
MGMNAPYMKATRDNMPLINREISWLSFNARVLQEAQDKRNPLIERLRFLGIFSNNLDEFYRVRVASLRRMTTLTKKAKDELEIDPKLLLAEIQKIVSEQQKTFEQTYLKLREECEKSGIHIINEQQLTPSQQEEITAYFVNNVRSALVPLMLENSRPLPRLKDKAIYLAIKLYGKKKNEILYSLIEVPSKSISRFYVFKNSKPGDNYMILLDDIIRANLKEIYTIFNIQKFEAFTIKFTRDAELEIDDDISTSLLEQISKSIEGRKSGAPVRFVYDKEMPDDLLQFLYKKIGITKDANIIAGGRYHNFKDFMGFPAIEGNKFLFEPLPPLKHPYIPPGTSVMDIVEKKDIMLNYPYQSFDYIIDLLREAAIHPDVKAIKINLYRVAKNSKIINALVNALNNGKQVQVIVELRARFDEENNINVSNVLQDAGADIIFGVKGLKVHSKLLLIEKERNEQTTYYAHVGTGNFHEGTARIYSDTTLLTCDPRIAVEVNKVFEFFENNYKVKRYSHLIISPNGSRRKLNDLINNEIKMAEKGTHAEIILKLNNLVDEDMIRKLYEASQAGVKIVLIIRGVCALVPGIKGWSENIEAFSIVDRFLEHSRILYFYNGGHEKLFISSADWMARNLDMRVEVSTPIYDKQLIRQLKKLLDIQRHGNVKARILDAKLSNKYRKTETSESVRSQLEIYNYFREKLDKTDTSK